MPGAQGPAEEDPEEPAGASAHRQGALSDSPWSLRKFYASLRGAHLRGRRAAPHDAHLHAIHLFLCVAFLCVSREAEADGEPANDSEDTSGYDSTASEPPCQRLPCLPLDSLVLPPPERMHQAADIWAMCRRLYARSPAFQRQLCRLGGVRACRRLMVMVIQGLCRGPGEEPGRKEDQEPVTAHAEVAEEKEEEEEEEEDSRSSAVRGAPDPSGPGSPAGSADGAGASESPHAAPTNGDSMPAPEEAEGPAGGASETALQSVRLLEALLAICLHGTRAGQHRAEGEPPGQVNTQPLSYAGQAISEFSHGLDDLPSDLLNEARAARAELLA